MTFFYSAIIFKNQTKNMAPWTSLLLLHISSFSAGNASQISEVLLRNSLSVGMSINMWYCQSM